MFWLTKIPQQAWWVAMFETHLEMYNVHVGNASTLDGRLPYGILLRDTSGGGHWPGHLERVGHFFMTIKKIS